MKFEKDRKYYVGAVDTMKDIIVDFKVYEASAATPIDLFVVNTEACSDGWPISFHFGKNLYQMRPKDFYAYRKFIVFESEKDIEDYNKDSHYTKEKRKNKWKKRRSW